MKVTNKSSLYFSAYKLKTLEAAIEDVNGGEQASPYLKSLLTSNAKTMSRIKISTMVNPYTENSLQERISTEVK